MTVNSQTGKKPRRVLAHIGTLSTAQLHLKNPYVVAFWSALFPGAGHLLLAKTYRAITLFLWEIFINLEGHINMALFYSFLGRFDDAREIIDIRWSLLYIPTYVFAIWDSYRATVDMNKQFLLASRENAPVPPLVANAFSINYLDKRSPFVAASWCALNPGLGQIMLQRIFHGVFIMFWWILVVYSSNFLTALNLTFFGEFTQAREALETQWFLNIPSIFFFCVNGAYVGAVENNKLFDRAQTQFLVDNYQSAAFPFPGRQTKEPGAEMYLVSVFKQSIEVELAVTALVESGVAQNDILAVPVDKITRNGRLFDTMRSWTGESLFDLPMILGAFAALLGSIYGYILAWGPVVWGALGAIAGFGIGLVIKIIRLKKKGDVTHENEVVIFVACADGKMEKVKQILSDNGALGVSLAGGAGTG